MDNTFINDTYLSDSDDSSSSSDNSTEYIDRDRFFLNMIKEHEYEKNRNKLFTKGIVKKNIVIDSHNYYQAGSNFNTSNFDVVFDYKKLSESNASSMVTTNYDIYSDVIGFRLLKTTIRTPPYNVNKTNNIIKYKRILTGTNAVPDNTIYTITINPGQYDIANLRDVFQKYEGVTVNNSQVNSINKKYTQYVTYSQHDGAGSNEHFTGEFYSTNVTNMTLPDENINDDVKGIKFLLKYSPDAKTDPTAEDPAITAEILWDYDNITRGAARLLGFLPKSVKTVFEDSNSSHSEVYSNRLLDISTHYADLVIPEIPSIACKRNSSGREIIERIQMKAGHGEYLHYRSVFDNEDQNYFSPIKLHRLNIQLWASNNELYDTNNSDVSFEFEITMVKDKKLLM